MFRRASLFLLFLVVTSSPLSVLIQADGPGIGSSIAGATWDGTCFYPKADYKFQLENYLGRWYQLAATRAWFSTGCSCVYAEYSLNTNETVNVSNTCQRFGAISNIQGTASAVDSKYGEKGVFRVQFPSVPKVDSCPGPNYIVQVYEGDWAIVQAAKFGTLFILSRKQNVPEAELDAWLKRAQELGSDLTNVEKTIQSGCSERLPVGEFATETNNH